MSRVVRSVLLLSMVGGVLLGAGCGKKGKRATDAGAPEDDAGADASPGEGDAGDDPDAGMTALSPFEAWREVQQALRARPDHRVARADALVEAGDPEALFLFVRDEIATYPPATNGFTNVLNAQRWGIKGTLRGGAGTPREKAELLVSLYQRAGLEAKVVRGKPDPERLSGEKILLGAPRALVDEPFSAEQIARWRSALGQSAPTTRPVIDPTGAQADALAEALLAQLPAELEPPFNFTLGDIPLVQVRVNGQWTYANPIAKDAAFGDSVTLDTPVDVTVASPTEGVTVRLEAARADTPYDRFVLVAREYSTDEVLGRKIHISFPPPVGTSSLVRMRAKDVTSFVPMLTVSGPDMTQEERDALAASGDVYTWNGDHYALDEAGHLTVNGVALPETNTDSDYLAKVAEAGVDAQASSFPVITLRVRVTDADGESVPQLGADAFTLTEDGAPVPFHVTQTLAPPPRVVLLFDQSDSVPEEFKGAGAVAIAQGIFSELYAAHPDAQVRVGTVRYGVDFVSSGWATSLAEANAQAEELATSDFASSEIWEALHVAAQLDPTLVVLVSDADPTDEPLPEYTNTIANGPPVITLGVGPVVQETVDEITRLSNGQSFAVDQQSEAIEAVLSQIGERALQDYVIRYTAPVEGPAERTVRIEVNGKSATVTYRVPEQPTVPPALSGLYLTLRVGTREVTRALAGFFRADTTAHVDITPEMLADVRAMLLGRVSFAVEAAAPSPSILLDDWIADKLSLEPLWDAVEGGDEAAILAALEQGFNMTPGNLPLALPPVPQANPEEALTFEDGLRAAAFIQKAGDGRPFRRQLDLFPLSRWATASRDGRDAFEKTLRATAALAVMEAELMGGESTLEALDGQPLSLVAAGLARNQDGLTNEQYLQWTMLERPFIGQQYRLLVPHAPGPFWAVHERNGTVMGILADGSGGAAEICGNFDAANRLIDAVGVLGGLAGASVGGWVALAKWEVEMVTMATLVISGEGEPGDLRNPAGDMACGALDGALGNAIPGYGRYGMLMGILGALGIDTGAPSLCGSLGFGGSGGVCGG